MDRELKEQFIAERARALAIMHLTRRDDLVIVDEKSQVLLMQIGRDPSLPRRFGVLVQGAMSPVTPEQANKVLRFSVQRFKRLGPFSCPVCLFFFTMRDNQGYSTWLLEPTVEQGHPRLVPREEPDCEILDNDTLGQIVAAVNAWYDAVPAETTG
jgi:hypothetical protein